MRYLEIAYPVSPPWRDQRKGALVTRQSQAVYELNCHRKPMRLAVLATKYDAAKVSVATEPMSLFLAAFVSVVRSRCHRLLERSLNPIWSHGANTRWIGKGINMTKFHFALLPTILLNGHCRPSRDYVLSKPAGYVTKSLRGFNKESKVYLAPWSKANAIQMRIILWAMRNFLT